MVKPPSTHSMEQRSMVTTATTGWRRLPAAWVVWAILLLVGVCGAEAAINPAPQSFPGMRRPTNVPNASARSTMRTNPVPAAPSLPRSSLTNNAMFRAAARTNALNATAAHTNAVPAAPAKTSGGITDSIQRLQPNEPAQMAVLIGGLCLGGLFFSLARSKAAARPAWLQWGCRVLGGAMILVAAVLLAGTVLALTSPAAAAGAPGSAPQRTLMIQLSELVGQVLFLMLGIGLVRVASQTSGEGAQAGAAMAATPSRASLKLPQGAARNVQACNVLQSTGDKRHLWHFDAHGGSFVLNRQQSSQSGESLPAGLVNKSWGTLFKHRLNVAWLPPEQVFLRVAQFPLSDLSETLSMVELQLEKLSPMPVAQVVWTIDVMPHPKGNMQTVVVMIAARSAVEEFLGQLEGQGYLADRLELPLLDQLQALPHQTDGAWIFPQAVGGPNTALVAWWYGGVLQNLDLLNLPATHPEESLKEQLTQMAWSGEMEGWLTSPPRWHLVADPVTAAAWEPALKAGLETGVEVIAPLTPAELAGLTARRAAQADPRANLLPAEFATRYHQQFVDRLWLRGLMALGAVYLVGVAIYGLFLGYQSYQTTSVENDVWQYSQSYSNAVQLKARYQILQDREDLKFAALECWNYVAKLMPTEMTLDTLNFSDGKKLTLSGTVPGDQTTLVNDFETAMRKAKDARGEPFFDPVGGEHFILHPVPGGAASWTFSLELKRAEVTQ